MVNHHTPAPMSAISTSSKPVTSMGATAAVTSSVEVLPSAPTAVGAPFLTGGKGGIGNVDSVLGIPSFATCRVGDVACVDALTPFVGAAVVGTGDLGPLDALLVVVIAEMEGVSPLVSDSMARSLPLSEDGAGGEVRG